MSRLLSLTPGLLLMVSWGCSLCANPHDCKFAAYGGVRERADMVHGRVASVIDPASEVSHATSVEQSPAAGSDAGEGMKTLEPGVPTPADLPSDDAALDSGDGWPDDSADAEQPSSEPLPRLDTAPDTELPEIPQSPNGPAGTIELPEIGPEVSPEVRPEVRPDTSDELPSEPDDSLDDLFGQDSRQGLADDLAAHFKNTDPR